VALVFALLVEGWEDSVIARPLEADADQHLLTLMWLEFELSTEGHRRKLGQ
jgi:hypothetical protein